MEIIKLKYKQTIKARMLYECEITDNLNKIVGYKNEFTICNQGLEYIYRIYYGNISIGDFMCDRDSGYLYNNLIKISMYPANFEYTSPKLSNSTINEIYRYLKSLENKICFTR